MVSGLVLSAVDGGFEPKTIQLVFTASLVSKHHLGIKSKTRWIRMRIIYPRRATYLSVEYCFNEIASTIKIDLVIESGYHYYIIYVIHEMFNCRSKQTNTHSLYISWGSLFISKDLGIN